MGAAVVVHSSAARNTRGAFGVRELPVIERLELQVHGGDGWAWRSPVLAEVKGNQCLRELYQRSHGAALPLTVRVWWSTGAQPCRETEWQHAELVLDVPSRKAPQLVDLVAAGLFQQAQDPTLSPEQAKAAWRDAEGFLGKPHTAELAKRLVLRCLGPTSRVDHGFIPPAHPVQEPVRSRVDVLAVRITGLDTPWYRPRIHRVGEPSDPDGEAAQHIRDVVPFGVTRRLRIELTLPGDRVFCFPLRYGGGMQLPTLTEAARSHCRRPRKNITLSHRRVLAHLARYFAGAAGLDDFALDGEVLDAQPRQATCPCGQVVPLRRALVAGFPVLVLAAHPALRGKTAWTGLCDWIDRAYTDLDQATPVPLDQSLPERSRYTLDRTDWWMGIRLTTPPELGIVPSPKVNP